MENPQNTTEEQSGNPDIIMELTSEVISAYVSNNTIATSELPTLIREVFTAFSIAGAKEEKPAETNIKPAVSIKRSVTDDYIICLDDGKKFKSLKRHLRSHYDMSPEEYREKWGLPADYPMVAPNYAKARSALARKMGLGRKAGTKIRKRK